MRRALKSAALRGCGGSKAAAGATELREVASSAAAVETATTVPLHKLFVLGVFARSSTLGVGELVYDGAATYEPLAAMAAAPL